MKKQYVEQNVYDAALERIKLIFDNFKNVLVAFSCGKDSGVLLNMTYDYAKENNLLDRMGMYYMDYEADFEETDKFAYRSFCENFEGIKKYWLCLPIKAQCACTMFGNYWIPWDKDKKDIWVKEMPTQYVINEDNVPYEFKKGTYGADARVQFGEWFASEYGETAVLVGIRCDESLNRLSILTSTQRKNMFNDIKWSKKYSDNMTAFYPLYDWNVSDIWTANSINHWDYNKTYDLFYMAGLSPYEMRIASPFHSCGQATLKLYKAISPNTWSKMVSRVNGVNFTNLYGGTTLMGWKNITKPEHFTWKQYAEFLLSTLPEETRQKYEQKIKKSQFHWSVEGAARSEEFISQLEAEGVKVRRTGQTSKACKVNKDKEVIFIDEMFDDTNVTDFKKAPSWKRVCITIMKNDTSCLYMGFSRNKTENEKRKKAIEKWENIL